MLGHDGVPTGFYRNNLVTGEPITRCPLRDWLDASEEVRSGIRMYEEELYTLYQDGFLHSAGGVGDQDARYIDFMRHISMVRKQTEHRAVEIIRKRAKEENTA